jgi:hypothetical protein
MNKDDIIRLIKKTQDPGNYSSNEELYADIKILAFLDPCRDKPIPASDVTAKKIADSMSRDDITKLLKKIKKPNDYSSREEFYADLLILSYVDSDEISIIENVKPPSCSPAARKIADSMNRDDIIKLIKKIYDPDNYSSEEELSADIEILESIHPYAGNYIFWIDATAEEIADEIMIYK